MRTPKLRTLAVALAIVAAPALAEEPGEMGRKDVVYLNGSAKSEGEITFLFHRPDKDPIEVEVSVPQGAWAKRVNGDLMRRFEHDLPGDQFRFHTKDERKVVIEGRTKKNLFYLELKSNTVEGMNVTIREK